MRPDPGEGTVPNLAPPENLRAVKQGEAQLSGMEMPQCQVGSWVGS